ncbi:MAG: hypothetical protein ACT4P3_18850 [Betaproteobacteria bacterium]
MATVQQLLSHPAVQSSAVPLIGALAVGALLLRTRLAGLGIAAGFMATVYLVGNFAFEPLTATRRLVLVVTSAAVIGAIFDVALKPSRATSTGLPAIFAAASIWVFWNALVQRPVADALVAGGATAAFLAWLVATSQLLRLDALRAGAAGLGLGLGVGTAAILGASALLGQYGLALGAACGGFLLLALLTGKPAVAGMAVTLTLALVCGLVGAAAVLLADLAWWSLAVLGLAPLAARLPLPGKQGTWLYAMFACAYVFVVAAAACVLAYLATRS